MNILWKGYSTILRILLKENEGLIVKKTILLLMFIALILSSCSSKQIPFDKLNSVSILESQSCSSTNESFDDSNNKYLRDNDIPSLSIKSFVNNQDQINYNIKNGKCNGISFPQLSGMDDVSIQNKVNRSLQDAIAKWTQKYKSNNIQYEVKTQNNQFISITFNVYSKDNANVIDNVRTLNYDLVTGKKLGLKDFYRVNSMFHYITMRSNYLYENQGIALPERLSEYTFIYEIRTCDLDDWAFTYYTSNSIGIVINDIQQPSHFLIFNIPYEDIYEFSFDFLSTSGNLPTIKTSALIPTLDVKYKISKKREQISENIWFEYPRISGLQSIDIEEKINAELYDIGTQKMVNLKIADSYNEYVDTNMQYEVTCVSPNYISVVFIYFHDETKAGAAHWFHNVQTANFNLVTGERVGAKELLSINTDLADIIFNYKYRNNLSGKLPVNPVIMRVYKVDRSS